MKKVSKYSIRTAIGLIVTVVLILNLSQGITKGVQTIDKNERNLSLTSLIPHEPISITSDEDFEVFPGTGTVEDPYVIEGYNITTTSIKGIYITDTTKFFIVRNCYVDAKDNGIYITDVADGTAIITNNTCSVNKYTGITLGYSDSSTITNNTCTNNGYAMFLLRSSSSIVINNICSNNGFSIYIDSFVNSTVSNNICSNNAYGILILSTVNSTVVNNTCSNNYYGIWIRYSDFCVITYNTLQENEQYGLYLFSDSDNNYIHHNNIVDNNLGGTSQAYDDGVDNTWYKPATQEGNYWSDWSGIGNYSIDGSAGTVDLYPLGVPVIAEYPQTLLLTLLLSIVTLFVTRTISRKTKKK